MSKGAKYPLKTSVSPNRILGQIAAVVKRTLMITGHFIDDYRSFHVLAER